MKLRNKKTGEIGNLITICASTRVFIDGRSDKVYNSLAELNAEWEDMPEEEPKGIQGFTTQGEDVIIRMGSIEEVEKVVEKLKAWKRLKDKGFKFTDWNCPCRELEFTVDEDKFFKASGGVSKETRADLDLLFGGEE